MFTNDTIDTDALPRFEAVPFIPIHPDYWKVTLIGIGILFVLVAAGLGALFYLNPYASDYALWLLIAYAILLAGTTFFSRMAFRRKGYAFREHDVLFRSGVISLRTIVIPYNRVQHVALHEGYVARQFGLAEIQVFTAGGSGSELEIPGIPKDKAEDIKQLLMGKIRTAL